MRTAITLGVAALALLATPVSGQNRTISGRGTGSLTVANTSNIPLYLVNFKQSGRTLTLVFMGKNAVQPFTLEGTITGNASGSVLPVEITGGLREGPTRGSGRIVLSGNSLASVTLNGTAKEGPFRIEFRGEDGGGGDWAGGGNTGAQPINVSSIGSGTYQLGSRRADLSDMRVRLRDDGRAELSFDGQQSVRGQGTWRRGSGGRADIALDEWNGRRTSGTAAVSFSGNAIERVDVYVPSQNARVEFFPGRTDSGDWGGGNTGAGPINMSTLGSGTYELSGRRTSLNEMRIRLHDDGRAELRFDGDRGDVEAKGTWRRGNDGRAEINITEWNGRRTSGSAAVTYQGRQIERVAANVPAQNARVEFYPRRTDGGGDWGGDNNSARPVNTSFVGTGSFRDRNRTYQLDEVSIRLRDGGEAELRFNGERQTSGRGRWTPNGSYATLTIQEWDGRKAKGSGTVTFAGNQPQQVNVTLQGARSVTFRSTPQIQPR
jgi:hypothetical protein